MYLKTLTLRGFKSFASATTLNFEPGITCVVGPNGSGKSNVVDALAWVMGEQGAKTLRGGNMADVIFAGTSSRAPLGRAEVSLTIDNSDGALPIEYTEVTISRTLFRNGGSEYAINGSPCRLLDIQELLSDTGMGREMHVIVGQGQLDSVLSATPEDRRAFIEEAAGVLKHRRRKEKALRKLESTEANVARLTDLVGEIRRQLGPLARQAEVARKAHVVQSDLRDSRARLLADDLAQLLANLAAEEADETAVKERRTRVESAQAEARARLTDLETRAAKAAPEVNEAAEMWFRLSSVRERLRGTSTLARERIRLLGAPAEEERPARDPGDLDDQAARAREAEGELRGEQYAAADKLAELIAARQDAEAGAAAAEQELTVVHRGLADRREGLAKLTGEVSAKRSRLEATEAEIERLRRAHTAALNRADESHEKYRTLEQHAVEAETGEEELKTGHTAALALLEEKELEVEAIRESHRSAATAVAAWQARREALELALARKDATGALLDEGAPGIFGAIAGEIHVEPGFESAIAAALGQWSDAAVADSVESAADALAHSRETEAGIANLLIAQTPGPSAETRTESPRGNEPAPVGTWAEQFVECSPRIRAAIARMLAGVTVVESLEAAREAAGMGLVGVTTAGDVVGPFHARGGLGGGPSTLELHAAREEAEAQIAEATRVSETAEGALAPAQEALQRAQADVAAALGALNESGAQQADVSRTLAELGATARSSSNEATRAQEAIDLALRSRAVIAEELTSLTERLEVASQEPQEDASLPHATSRRDTTAEAASAARGKETDARLALRTLEERRRAITGRAESLERAARTERAARQAAEERAQQRAEQAQKAETVANGAARALAAIEFSLEKAQRRRDELAAAREQRDAQIVEVREELDGLGKALAELTDVVHKDELARASQIAKIEQLQQRSIDELGLDSDVLTEEFGPHQMVPMVEGEEATEVPFVREEQEKRMRRAERSLALLGRVNPLALEEHKALEERHKFLADQLADIRSTRTELLGIVKDIDERVEAVFGEAFADTAREFEGVFARLFPGGQGRLTLTDPSDMLTSGIEVEARPPGKKVKRLSLLSGGERSLTAVAMLIAIFKARPSPFYVMDEVEAALDDVNLGRLIDIFAELRQASQLIVITHQKRTMEIADALYGVAMRGDGVTSVISQRMHEAVE